MRAARSRYAGGALSRRRSLATLGGAALGAAIAGTESAGAGKVAKKARKRSKKKCKRQVDQCRTVFLDFCAEEDADCDEETLADILACCSDLAGCQAGAALDCFFAVAS